MPADVQVTGPRAPAEIMTDPWGIPHIYASSTHDAFWAQGFQVARDRLWQIDTWRRRGLGLLAQVWGAEYAEQDRAARLFLFRGDMHAEWLAYASDTKEIATAFTAGINAYVGLTREDPSRLPLEFRELGYEPAFWEPSDVARIRSHGLFHNVAHEVARALMLRDFGPATEELWRRREPGGELTVPDGLDLSVIPDDVLRDYMLAIVPASTEGPAGPRAAPPVPRRRRATAATTGRWRRSGPRPGGRCWRTTRTGRSRCPRSGTSRISALRASTSSEPGNRPCPACRSATTVTWRSGSRCSPSIRRTCTCTGPGRVSPGSTGTGTGGSR